MDDFFRFVVYVEVVLGMLSRRGSFLFRFFCWLFSFVRLFRFVCSAVDFFG